jgi:hypothetical protein
MVMRTLPDEGVEDLVCQAEAQQVRNVWMR